MIMAVTVWSLLLIIFTVLTYMEFKKDKAKASNTKKIFYIFFLFLAICGVWANSSSSDSKSSDSSQNTSSSESSKSESSKEDSEVAKAKVKNTCNAINQQIDQHQELAGFKLKPADDQFTVVVPPTATSLSDNEQKSVYQSMLKLIYDYDNGTNDGTFVEFQDQMGNPIARSSYTGSGEVKLMK